MTPPTFEWDSSHITVDIQNEEVPCMLITVDPFTITRGKEVPPIIFYLTHTLEVFSKIILLPKMFISPNCTEFIFSQVRCRCTAKSSLLCLHIHFRIFHQRKGKLKILLDSQRKGDCGNTCKHSPVLSKVLVNMSENKDRLFASLMEEVLKGKCSERVCFPVSLCKPICRGVMITCTWTAGKAKPPSLQRLDPGKRCQWDSSSNTQCQFLSPLYSESLQNDRTLLFKSGCQHLIYSALLRNLFLSSALH